MKIGKRGMGYDVGRLTLRARSVKTKARDLPYPVLKRVKKDERYKYMKIPFSPYMVTKRPIQVGYILSRILYDKEFYEQSKLQR